MPYTPGPWFAADWQQDDGPNKTTIEVRERDVVGPGETSIWPDGVRKKRIAETTDGENPIEDARLIAAAPEMLCVLQCIMDEVGGSSILSIATKQQAQTALAKARGESKE